MIRNALLAIALLTLAVSPRGRAQEAPGADPPPLAEAETLAGASVRLVRLERHGTRTAQGAWDVSISIQGAIVREGEEVLLVGPQLFIAEAVDESGASLLGPNRATVEGQLGSTSTSPSQRLSIPGGRPVHATGFLWQVNRRVARIATLRGFAPVAIPMATKSVEFSAQPAAEFADLVPGMQAKVESVQLDATSGGQIGFRLQLPPSPQGNSNLRALDPPILQTVELMDESGKAWPSQAVHNSGGSSGTNSPTLLSHSARFAPEQRPEDFGQPRSLRMTIITAVQQRRVPFEAKDIPVP